MKFKIKYLLIAVALVCGTVGCTKPETGFLWRDEWNEPDPEPEPEPDPKPEPEPDPKPDPDPKPEIKGKPRLVWIDAGANFNDYANSESKIASDVKKIAETGFTHIVVDVRPTNTGVLFKSGTESALKKVDAWINGAYKWVERTESFDYLQKFIDEGHKNGLKVFASMNTFVGGYYAPYGLVKSGIFYDGTAKKEWASVVNTADGLKNTLDIEDTGTKFLSPANDEVQTYMLNLIGDLAVYDVDGIILDRCRFDDYSLQSDFSDASRKKFEEYLGKKVDSWPSDIFAPGQEDLGSSVTSMQQSWLAFRAKVIHDFVEKVSDKVHSVNADCQFGAYVGAWYSSYYESGVNWASPKYDPKAAGYSWANSDYKNYGYADHCDVMIIGAYAASDAIYGSSEWTMEGFCKRAADLFKGDVPYYGGPDIGNSTGFEKGGQGALMPEIVDACIGSADGFFVFDLCHIKMYGYWANFKDAFDRYLATVK